MCGMCILGGPTGPIKLTESNSVTAVRALTGQNLDWGNKYPKLMVYPYDICMSNKGPQGAPMQEMRTPKVY